VSRGTFETKPSCLSTHSHTFLLPVWANICFAVLQIIVPNPIIYATKH